MIESSKTAETVESQSSFATSWTKDLRFSDSPEGGVPSTDVSLVIDPKVKLEQIKDLQGTLTLQFPKTLQTLRLDDLTVGQKAQMEDLTMTMTVTARGRRKLTLQANKDGHKVVYVRLYNAEGKSVRMFSPGITASAGGTWSFELSPLSTYTRAEVVLAGELDRKAYPFLLAVK